MTSSLTIDPNIANELAKQVIIFREKAEKKNRFAGKLQTIFDEVAFKTDPNTYLDNFFKNYNNLEQRSNKVVGFLTKLKLNVSESRFNVLMLEHAILILKAKAEMQSMTSNLIEEISNNVEFQQDPKAFISASTKRHSAAQASKDDLILTVTINIFREIFHVEDEYGSGRIVFLKGF